MTHPPLYRKSPYRGLKIVLLAVILIYGVAAELMYIDADSQTRFRLIHPT